MNPLESLNKIFRKLPVHVAVITMCILWVIPTVGLFVTSFRSREAVRTSGWWTIFQSQPQEGLPEYTQYCASCHGDDGKAIPSADLSDPAVINQYSRAANLLVMLRKPINGNPHLVDPPLPSDTNTTLKTLASIQGYMLSLSGQAKSTSKLTLSNYIDALVGYKGTQDTLRTASKRFQAHWQSLNVTPVTC